jgi:hypothetical protein
MRSKFIIASVIIFVVLSAGFYALKIYAPDYSFITLECGNLLMVLLSLGTFLMVARQKKSRPHAFVRGVSSASFLKLMVCMVAMLVYVLLNRSHIHKPSVFVLMGIYAVYSIMETSALSKLVRE